MLAWYLKTYVPGIFVENVFVPLLALPTLCVETVLPVVPFTIIIRSLVQVTE